MFQNHGCTMQEALHALKQQGIRARQTSQYQIKVGIFNFYPNKGTIFVDGGQTLDQKGISAFVEALRKAGHAPAASPRKLHVQTDLQDEDDLSFEFQEPKRR